MGRKDIKTESRRINVSVKNMDKLIEDNYGPINKVLTALYGVGPYSVWQVQYATKVYENRNCDNDNIK